MAAASAARWRRTRRARGPFRHRRLGPRPRPRYRAAYPSTKLSPARRSDQPPPRGRADERAARPPGLVTPYAAPYPLAIPLMLRARPDWKTTVDFGALWELGPRTSDLSPSDARPERGMPALVDFRPGLDERAIGVEELDARLDPTSPEDRTVRSPNVCRIVADDESTLELRRSIARGI